MRDSSEYVVPIFAFGTGEDGAETRRFIGSGFFVRSPETIISCRHVLEKPSAQEISFRTYHFKSNSWHEISDIWLHPKMDIAIGTTKEFGAKVWRPFTGTLTLGGDVSVFSYLEDDLGGRVAILPSTSKGYIVNQPVGLNAMVGMGVYTLSFPSLPGFSGSPVEVFDSSCFVGMLFNNRQTDITVFSFEEV